MKRYFILTGAGISAESGIRTFRDHNGLWENHPVEEVATPEGFKANPHLVWRFYGERRQQALTVHPNPAHQALAKLEHSLGDHYLLCTQNVDDLHERAGSKRMVHMHGELFKSRCSDPNCESAPFEDKKFGWIHEKVELPTCACGQLQRPHIVWFGEMPIQLDTLFAALEGSDVFICIGSSGSVYPAAAFVQAFKESDSNKQSIYVGLEPPDNAEHFDDIVLGKAGEVLPDFVDSLIG